MNLKLKELCLKFYEVGALKFGDFKMKVGVNSPVYFDLRIMVSHPNIMELLSKLLWEFAQAEGVACDILCGVPYTALPVTTLIAVNNQLPMLIRRKEPKDYGTKKLIEGEFHKEDLCLIVEDVVVTGCSILETANDLRKEGLTVKECVVVLDREQGGMENLDRQGITMKPLLKLTQVLRYLREANKINDSTIAKIKTYVEANQLDPRGEPIKTVEVSRLEMALSDRAALCSCPISARLLQVMQDKQSILCVAADVTSTSELLRLAAAVGPYTALLKTHSDIVADWTPEVATQLRKLANQHNFLIMEDRKFADIGNTVGLQYSLVHGWADLVTVHGLAGDGVLAGIEAVISKHTEPRGVFLVAQLSCADNLVTPQYTKSVMRLAASRPELVAGLVCQSPEVVVSPGLLQLTAMSPNSLGNSPRVVVNGCGADLVVVGKSIIAAVDQVAAAKEYKTLLWDAYLERIKH